MEVELTILDHSGAETGIILHSLPAIIGRDETVDVHLKDPWASHRHCEIDRNPDVLVVCGILTPRMASVCKVIGWTNRTYSQETSSPSAKR